MINNKFFSLSGLNFSEKSFEQNINFIIRKLVDKDFGYVCVTNSRSLHISKKNSDYLSIQNNSLITVPDGQPIVWIGRNLGFKNIQKTSGLDLMIEIFKISSEKNYSHFFFGSSEGVLNQIVIKLNKEYPDLRIAGIESPPFLNYYEFDFQKIYETINQTKPDFFWVGLGAPKQELFMNELKKYRPKCIQIGVGLAFDYYSTNVRRAPFFFRKLGFEWFFRILSQPKRVNIKSLIAIFWILIPLLKSILWKK